MSEPPEEITIIVSDTFQCPLCGEKSYILVHILIPMYFHILCLSCCYDGSMEEDFLYIGVFG